MILGDINNDSLLIASKILNVHNYEYIQKILLNTHHPFFNINTKIDIFYSNGVLHHTPFIKEILIEALNILTPDGEIRLLLYSDKMWSAITNKPMPPIDYNIQKHEDYWLFLRTADLVGQYVDFYSEEKLIDKLGNKFKVIKFDYICGSRIIKSNSNNLKDCFCTVIIKPNF